MFYITNVRLMFKIIPGTSAARIHCLGHNQHRMHTIRHARGPKAPHGENPFSTGAESAVIKRVAVILNVRSGTRSSAEGEEMRRLFRDAGIDAEIIDESEDLTAATKQAAPTVDAVIAAGGDGTINSVAAGLVGTDLPIGVLPRGTVNHFARDLGLPMALPEAIAVIARGQVMSVDVAEMNGRPFVNNSSIGFYPRIVKHRDRLRARQVLGKWMAMLYALLAALRRFAQLDVSIQFGGQRIHLRTPFVFVGNNCYTLDLLSMGERPHLDRGELCVYLAHRPGRFGLLRLLVLALFRRLRHARDFEELKVTEVTIDTRRKLLPVAIDGEVHHLAPPLHYRIRPRALRVLVP